MHAYHGKSPEAAARPTILLVEDDVLLRMATAEDLREAGFLVLEAANADEALVVLRGSTSVDVVVTDIRMPGSMDGGGLAEFVRATWPQLKIFVLSATVPTWPTGALIDSFFGKPVDIRRVVDRLHELFPRSQT